MNLILDLGNTAVKAALVQGINILERSSSPVLSQTFLEDQLQKHPIEAALISNVAEDQQELLSWLRTKVNLHQLSAESKLPFKMGYGSPQTLGTDRMANAAAAASLYPKKPCLCIDIGTCIKFDFTDASGTFLGGSISPGISLRFKAMNDYTSRLPLLSGESFPEKFLGTTTTESMQSGVFYGILGELEGLMASYRESYPGLVTVLTGGDSHLFVAALKSNIFASPDFTLIGLNKILELNV